MAGRSLFPDVRRDVAYPAGSAAALFVAFVGLALLYQTLQGGAGAESLVTKILIDAIMVIGIQVYIGNTGVLSFGHIGFGAVAGYAFAVVAIEPTQKQTVIGDAPFGLADVHLSPIMAGVVAIVVTLVVAVVVGIGLARSGAKSGAVAATVITLALLFVSHELAVNWNQVTGGDRAGLSFSIGDTLQSRWPVYVALFGALLVALLFARSRTGRLAQAARDDNLAARAMGINPQVQQMIALLVSVTIVAVAASLRVYSIGNITPKFFFFEYTLVTLVMLIVGGRSSVTGALTGVAVISTASEIARRLATEGYELFGISLDSTGTDWLFREGLPDIVLGAAMLIFMIVKPDGLLRDWELDRWLHRRSHRADATPPVVEPVAAPAPVDLVVTGAAVSFGGFRALDGADITASNGEIVGLIGPNGAGKTTLVNVITGIVPPTEGSVVVAGAELTGQPTHRIARAGLVRTFQNLRLFSSLTVRDNVEAAALSASAANIDRSTVDIDALIAASGLWELRDRRSSELDYGNSRRLELARAAAARPRFLLLDEPTSGMSDAESLTMIDRVREMARLVGSGVIVIDHDLGFITGICDRIYCLDQGQVIAVGTPDEIQADPDVQAAYLGSATGA
jgi:branched-chain amino acid transport system permease protein